MDAVEAALWRSGIPRAQPTGLAAYVVAFSVAEGQLRLGMPVVVDAVNPVEEPRAGWRDLAARQGVPLRVIEVICPDTDEHRRRVRGRQPSADQAAPPSWDDLASYTYEPWTEPRLTVDASAPVPHCLAQILSFVDSR